MNLAALCLRSSSSLFASGSLLFARFVLFACPLSGPNFKILTSVMNDGRVMATDLRAEIKIKMKKSLISPVAAAAAVLSTTAPLSRS